MKVCLVSTSVFIHAGMGRMVTSIAKEFELKGHHVGYLTQDGNASGDILRIDFKTRNPLRFIRNFFSVLGFVRRYDVVLCFDILPGGFLVAFIALVLRKPFFLHCIGTYSLFHPASRLKNLLMAWVHGRSKKTFVLSTAVKEHIESGMSDFSLSDAVILPPGVQTDCFAYTEYRSSLIGNDPYIITVGAIKSRKGQDLSLEAFGQLAEAYPALQYVMVGDFDRSTEFAKKLETILSRYRLHDRVHFLHGVTDEELRKLYSHALFFIMTSRTTDEFIEGFGIVYLEAALCGLAAIGAKMTGAEDAIVDGMTGLLVEPDVGSIGVAMGALLEDEDLRMSLSQKAIEHAKLFTWGKTVDTYLEYFASS